VVFAAEEKEATGGCVGLQDDEPRPFNTVHRILQAPLYKEIRSAGYVVRVGAIRNLCKCVIGEREAKTYFGVCVLTCEDNIK
jgi:hypothetical protein